MSRRNVSLEVAESYLSSAERELETAARWLGRAKRCEARDLARLALADIRGILTGVRFLNGGRP